MGCGKSSVGRRISALTGHRFVDTDDLVAQHAGRSIPEIFAEEGEEGFRLIEENVIAELIGVAGVVLATGGGAILREKNREALRRIGVVVWLDAATDVLFERASRSHKRPLLQTDDPRATFGELLSARLSIYETAADVRVDSTDLAHDEVARRAIEQAMRFHSGASANPPRREENSGR